MATHSSILAWEIPWTEEPGGLQSMGSERVRHNLENKNNNNNSVIQDWLSTHTHFTVWSHHKSIMRSYEEIK